MPLSEEEARLLHQLEQSLAAEDPDFASTLRGSKLFAHNRKIALFAALGFVVGVILLFAGAVMAITVVGVIGFISMLASVYVFLNAYRRGIGTVEEEANHNAPPKPSGSFVDRMEERWNRRQEGDDYR
ncbi:MAG: DUF3040 domain-containing protein [Aeromicrobium sp.]